MPVVTKVNITRYGAESARDKDDFPKLSAYLLNAAKYLINESEDLSVRQVICFFECLSKFELILSPRLFTA